MEESVTSADYVLIICTPTYKKKADDRIGGIGYEGHIISDELYSRRNERKFIPVLKEGTFEECTPTYLSGKVGVDLSNGFNGEDFDNLIATLFGAKKKPRAQSPRYHNPIQSETINNCAGNTTIRIVGIIVDEVTSPRNDGTPGCALYRVPFRLSRVPGPAWKKYFLETWNMPPKWSSMHRPGIASIFGDKIILDGTTIEEVRDVHRETLLLCVDAANELEAQYFDSQHKEAEKKRMRQEAHRNNVLHVADSIIFR